MPLNLLKKYPELLELEYLAVNDRTKSLFGIFKRDIEDNANIAFRSKKIYPTKHDGDSMQILFNHLITEEISSTEKRRIFEMDRAKRLHWIKDHIEESCADCLEVFSVEEKKQNGHKAINTYIYNPKQKYVLVFELQRSKNSYYFLTAYYLNKDYGEKALNKRKKKKLKEVF